VPNTKVVPNIQIYLQYNFLRSLSIFPRINSFLCCTKNTLGKKEIIFLHGPNPSRQPNPRSEIGSPQLPSVCRCQMGSGASGAHLSTSPLCAAPPVGGFFHNLPCLRVRCSRRESATATPHPIALDAYRRRCRATPPVRMPSGHLVPSHGRAVASTLLRSAPAIVAAAPPQCLRTSRSMTPSRSARRWHLLSLPCARRLAAELSTRIRIGHRHSRYLAFAFCHVAPWCSLSLPHGVDSRIPIKPHSCAS
jgi:hypothetical protein